MSLPRLVLSLLLLAVGSNLLNSAQASDSMRCGSRLVTVEARAAELLAVCGEPAYRDVWGQPVDPASDFVAEVEEWTYDFGPSQLLRIVRLRNARVVAIDSEGYGFAPHATASRRCGPETIATGLSKYRLLKLCGAPLTRSVQSGFRAAYPGADPRYRPGLYSAVFREEWVYDFGPRYFMRVLTLENGRVVAVENSARGTGP
jgi:hypothetical protein